MLDEYRVEIIKYALSNVKACVCTSLPVVGAYWDLTASSTSIIPIRWGGKVLSDSH